MKVVFIDPHFQRAVAFVNDYSKISAFVKDFMVHEEIDGVDFLLGSYGDWEVYVKIGTYLKFCGAISDVLATY